MTPIGPLPPAEVGKEVIFASNQRQTADKDFKVLSYVPEPRDLTFVDGGWPVGVASVHGLVRRIGGCRADSSSWHGAHRVQKDAGRQLELFPRGGDRRQSELQDKWS